MNKKDPYRTSAQPHDTKQPDRKPAPPKKREPKNYADEDLDELLKEEVVFTGSWEMFSGLIDRKPKQEEQSAKVVDDKETKTLSEWAEKLKNNTDEL